MIARWGSGLTMRGVQYSRAIGLSNTLADRSDRPFTGRRSLVDVQLDCGAPVNWIYIP